MDSNTDNRKHTKADKKCTSCAFDKSGVIFYLALFLIAVSTFVVTFGVLNIISEKQDRYNPSKNARVYITSDSENKSQRKKKNPITRANNTKKTVNSDHTNKTTSSANSNITSPGGKENEYKVFDYPEDTSSWELLLVNMKNRMSKDAEDKIVTGYLRNSGEMMDERAAKEYNKMYDAALEDGYKLTPCSGYRSFSSQKMLYDASIERYVYLGYSYENAVLETKREIMPPGASEHNLGFGIDIICAEFYLHFENTDEYKWLNDNASDYGFILRYPKDKEDITGVKFEPWHWRYVGVKNAKEIKASGLCLEEYIGN